MTKYFTAIPASPFTPNCLIYRYDGSDMLEPACIIKVCKNNVKVATTTSECERPITIAKNRVYNLNEELYQAIITLRNERHSAVLSYEEKIQANWQQLSPYNW